MHVGRWIIAVAILLISISTHAVPVNNGAQTGTIRTYSAKTLGSLKLKLGFGANYAYDSKYVKGNTELGINAGKVVDTTDSRIVVKESAKLISSNLYLGLGLTSFLDLSLSLPVYLDVAGFENVTEWGIGDAEMVLKLLYPPPGIRRVFYQGYLFSLSIPTGTGFSDKGVFPRHVYYYEVDGKPAKTFYTSERPNLGVKWLMTFDIGTIARNFQFLIDLNIGANFSLDSERENTAVGGIAFTYKPAPPLAIFVEAFGESRWFYLQEGFEIANDPLMLSPGITITAPVGLEITMAGDFSLSSILTENRQNWVHNRKYAYSTSAWPRWGFQFQFAWSGYVSPQDEDGDGIKDNEDRCPRDAEDMDGFEDSDGCPDPDNDKDGIPDIKDKCPNKAEDQDGFEDEDGCPDPDNDGDGIPDVQDQCPRIAEDFDGFEDKDGCPDGDNDRDGIPDTLDKCPNDPEDIDNFEDDDGCPDVDNDKDGIPDLKDKCPNEPETFNGVDDEDGCPDEKKKEIKMPEHQILNGVKFRSGSVEMTYDSHQYLEPIINKMKEYPEIEIEIRGHTDSMGKYESNMRLSQMRAESVRRFLIAQGIDPKRMRAVGFGPSSPIADNRTAAGRAKNRRIEIVRLKP